MGTKSKRVVVTQDRVDNEALVAALESQGNVIPPTVAVVLRLAAPILARIAVRYIARKSRKKFSDSAVNATSQWIGAKVQGIIDRAAVEGK